MSILSEQSQFPVFPSVGQYVGDPDRGNTIEDVAGDTLAVLGEHGFGISLWHSGEI